MCATKIVLVSVFLILASAEEKPLKEYLKSNSQDHLACMKETSITTQDLKELDPSNVPENIYCFFRCLSQKMGVIKDDGVLDIERMKEMPLPDDYTKEKADKVVACFAEIGKIEQCSDMKKMDECEAKN